ncbi:MAG TPA: site-specific integrase [Candidatus Dormibacteraeota bacterium]|nr:site-specific integrase [Candidatus Dormibacteraeota bacterium]
MSAKPAKRVMGHGTVYLRADGRWSAQVAVEGRRRTVYGRTQADVVRKLQALQQQVGAGLPAVDQRATVKRYLDVWLGSVAPRVRPRTMRHYAYMVGLISGQVGRVKLAKLSPQDVAAMLARLQASGLSPQTCSLARATLRTALADAERNSQVGRNVAALASPPRVPHQQPRILAPDKAQAVIDALPDPGLRRLATLAVHSGLRQGELLGLRWQDVADGELHVTQALQRLGGEYQLVEVKSRASRRTVPLTAGAVDALAQERQSQLESRLAAGSGWREPIRGLAFTTATGAPRNGNAITHQFADALSAAGLPAMHWHHLRHAFAGLMLASGSDLSTVSSLLGHTSVNLTASTYAGVAPSLKRQAADRLGALLQQPG